MVRSSKGIANIHNLGPQLDLAEVKVSLVGCRLWGRTESDTTEVTQQLLSSRVVIQTNTLPSPSTTSLTQTLIISKLDPGSSQLPSLLLLALANHNLHCPSCPLSTLFPRPTDLPRKKIRPYPHHLTTHQRLTIAYLISSKLLNLATQAFHTLSHASTSNFSS